MVRGDYAGPQVGGFYLDPDDNRPEVIEVPVVETVTEIETVTETVEVPVVETVVEEDDPTLWIVIIVLVAVIGLVVACLVFVKGKKQVEHLEGLLAAAGAETNADYKTTKP